MAAHDARDARHAHHSGNHAPAPAVPRASTASATTHPAYAPPALAWTMWGLGAALYFIGFYQRVAPAVITAELSAAFSLTAAALGNLSAFYFYSYVAMQIPTGILVDRYGARRLLTTGAAVAAIGTAVFALAPNLFWANTGRLLIGGSVGVAFVAMLKLASHWMPPSRFATASGIALAVGVFGAVFAGAPLRVLVNEFGWRNVMWASAAITTVVAVATWWVVRDDPAARGYRSYADTPTTAHASSVFSGIRDVFRYRNVLLLFAIAGVASGMVLTFAGLWGVPFLTTHYGFSLTTAAALCSMMMVTWALGSIAYGALSNRMGRRKPLFIGGLAIALVLWAILLFVPRLPTPALVALLAAIGWFASCFILTFAFAKESVPARYAGTVSGVSNMGVIQGPMFLQPLVGVILDHTWQGTMANGKRVFDLASYQTAFSLVLVWGMVALALLLFTRETYCRQFTDTPTSD
jgi:nitrate/nitrite transporter NarK